MNNELPKTKIDEKTGIEYHLEGDYYIPNLTMPKQENITLNKSKYYDIGKDVLYQADPTCLKVCSWPLLPESLKGSFLQTLDNTEQTHNTKK